MLPDVRAVLKPEWRDRWETARANLIDLALAVLTAAAMAITIAITPPLYPETRSPDTFAYLLAAAVGAVVLFRRRWPVGVLMATFLLLQVYYWSGYPGIWPAIPLAVPLYTVAAAGKIWWSLVVVVWYWVIPLIVTVLGLLEPLAPTVNDLVRDGSLMLAAILAGDTARSHRALMAESAARLRRAEDDRQREARELSAARVIQQQLLPTDVPDIPGWQVAAYYQPANAIGGDFYDFLTLPDGQIAVVTGDVTDKGIPAALVMATTHSILRGLAQESDSPGTLLQRANDRLVPDTPPHMFVTCLYLVIDPASGRLRYANAGHNLPYVATGNGCRELRATGMPLGAMPDMTYEEQETMLAPGESVLIYSDGLVEAHGPNGEMFGFPRMQAIVAKSEGGVRLIDDCLVALRDFVGRDWEQEDDLTFVTLQRGRAGPHEGGSAGDPDRTRPEGDEGVRRILLDLSVPSVPGNERLAMDEVVASVSALGFAPRRLEQLKTAVAEATMNAMEHGNQYRSEVPVRIVVEATPGEVSVRISDEGSGPVLPVSEPPDLAAKLEGQQHPRGWGLFLIERMVDEVRVSGDRDHSTVELIMRSDASAADTA